MENLLVAMGARAGSAGPDFLGISNMNCNFQPSHTAGAGGPYPRYLKAGSLEDQRAFLLSFDPVVDTATAASRCCNCSIFSCNCNILFVDFVNNYVYNLSMKTSDNIYALAELASTQWGMFTSSQALAEHVSRVQLSRMTSDGRIEQLARGTYRFTYASDSPFVEVKAAWLSLSPSRAAYERLCSSPYDYVATARTAAVLLGDTEFHDFPYCFAAGKGKRTARSDVKLCPWNIERQDTVIAHGLPTASAERTVSDLIRLHEDPSLVGNFIEGMASRGHSFDLSRLAELLAPLALRNGFAKNDGRSFAEELVATYALEQMTRQIDIKRRQIELLTQLITKDRGGSDGRQL